MASSRIIRSRPACRADGNSAGERCLESHADQDRSPGCRRHRTTPAPRLVPASSLQIGVGTRSSRCSWCPQGRAARLYHPGNVYPRATAELWHQGRHDLARPGSNSASANWRQVIPCWKRQPNQCFARVQHCDTSWQVWNIMSANWPKRIRSVAD